MKRREDIELLLSFVRAASESSPTLPENLSTEQWTMLYTLSQEQGVLAMVWDSVQRGIREGHLSAENLSRELKIRWAMNVESIETKYMRQREVIIRLAKFFEQHNIKMMILKGFGLSLDYPTPSHRPCGDIDIWLFEEQAMADGSLRRVSAQERADELLKGQFKIDIDVDKHHHTVFYLGGVMVENHYDFMNIHAHRSNREIERRLQELSQLSIEPTEVDDTTIYLPSPDFHTLFLLRHSAAHFAAENIGIRHLLDWRFLIEKRGDKVDWQALMNIALQTNMHRFFAVKSAICIDHLGLANNIIPPFERDAALEHRVLNEIIESEFDERVPKNVGYLRSWSFMLRRWWSKRWKHRIVYRETLLETFFVQIWSHLLKPKSLKC